MNSIGKLKEFFGGGSSSTADEDGPADPETAVRPEETESEDVPEPSASAKAVPKTDTISLEVDVKFISLAPMTVSEKRDARQRCVYLYIINMFYAFKVTTLFP